ncbi:MAG: hypothetical protein EXR75_16750 [Myxococcales bacterium]|nr:hypothetical protein [Myxococcales bacterium]
MKWLWFAGPLVFLAVFLAVVLSTTKEDERRRAELERWLEELLGPYREAGRLVTRRVRALPSAFTELVARAGGGARVCDVMLVPKLAYVAVRAADGMTGSSQQTVVMKLRKAAPRFSCRPLPVVDGQSVDNSGLSLDDEQLFAAFLIEGAAETKAALHEWLSPELRDALLELPSAWLSTDGATLALTQYGALSAEQLDDLTALADAFYSEHGAAPGSLLGDPAEASLAHAALLAKPSEAKPSPTKLSEAKPSPTKLRSTKASAPKSPLTGTATATSPPAAPSVGAPAQLQTRMVAALLDFGLLGASALFLALAWGSVHAFHPLVFFNHPDPVVTQPWQGGFTTKGIGLFFAAEAFLVGLVALELFLYATRGRTLGMFFAGIESRAQDPRSGLVARLLRGQTLVAESRFLPRVQLGRGKADPIVAGQVLRVTVFAGAFIIVSIVLNASKLVAWF